MRGTFPWDECAESELLVWLWLLTQSRVTAMMWWIQMMVSHLNQSQWHPKRFKCDEIEDLISGVLMDANNLLSIVSVTNYQREWTNLYLPTPLPKLSLSLCFFIPNHPFDLMCLWHNKQCKWMEKMLAQISLPTPLFSDTKGRHELPASLLLSCFWDSSALIFHWEKVKYW